MREKVLLFATLVWTTQLNATTNKLVDCSYISPNTTECMPYPSKFMYPKELATGKNIDFLKPHNLIISKTTPLIEKPKILKIIRVEDMIENHVKVFEPSRFVDIQSHSAILFANEDGNQTVDDDSNATTIEDLNATTLENSNTTTLEDSNATEVDELDREAIEDTNETKKEIEPPTAKRQIVVKKIIYPKYIIKKGDTLNRIAKMFGLSTKEILTINTLGKNEKLLKIGQDIDIPLTKYRFNMKIKKYEREKQLSLLVQKLNEVRAIKRRQKTLNEFGQKFVPTVNGTHSLRVQTTAYTSHERQTDNSPFIAAWGNHIRPGMKIVAVSRDLISKYGLSNGKQVRIQGLPGYYTVRDKMNQRFRQRVDIYMGLDRRKALRWGRRRAVISW